MPQGTAAIGSFIWLIVLFGIMYFFMIRPQQQQQKKRQKMLSELKKGDKIFTVGGIRGVITDIKEDLITLKIADKVEIELLKSGVGYVDNPKKDKEK